MRRKISEREKRENRRMLAFYRSWMCRVRTKDLIQDLGALEGLFRRRADWLSRYCQPHPLLSEHSIKVFQNLEKQERSLVERFAFMREKLGWVLDDLMAMEGIPATTATAAPPADGGPVVKPDSSPTPASGQTAA